MSRSYPERSRRQHGRDRMGSASLGEAEPSGALPFLALSWLLESRGGGGESPTVAEAPLARSGGRVRCCGAGVVGGRRPPSRPQPHAGGLRGATLAAAPAEVGLHESVEVAV